MGWLANFASRRPGLLANVCFQAQQVCWNSAVVQSVKLFASQLLIPHSCFWRRDHRDLACAAERLLLCAFFRFALHCSTQSERTLCTSIGDEHRKGFLCGMACCETA